MITIAFERKNNKVRYLGEMNFDDLVNRYSDYLFERDGKLYDDVGTEVSDITEGDVGIIEFDNSNHQVFAIDANDLEYYFGVLGAVGWAEEIAKEYCSEELNDVLSQWID